VEYTGVHDVSEGQRGRSDYHAWRTDTVRGDTMTGFIIGMMLGGCIGVIVMCMFIGGRRGGDGEH